MSDFLTTPQAEAIVARLAADRIEADVELVRDVAAVLAERGTVRGGNRWGMLGTCIAMEIEKV